MQPNFHDETVNKTNDKTPGGGTEEGPDVGLTVQFTDWLYGPQPSGYIYRYAARTVNRPDTADHGKDITHIAHYSAPAKIDSQWWRDSARHFNQTFCVGLVTSNEANNKTENMASYHAVWVDLDACKKLSGLSGKEFFKVLDDDPNRPSCRVRSSEHGIQFYFKLDTPVMVNGNKDIYKQELEPILLNAALYYGGDLKVALPTAQMRLPGSVNKKKEYPKPFLVRPYWDADAEQRVYTLDEVKAMFAHVTPDTVPLVISTAIIRAIEDIYTQGSRNETALYLAATVRKAGMDKAGCRNLFKAIRRVLGDDSDRADQVDRTYQHENPKSLAQEHPEIHAQVTDAVQLWAELKEEYCKKIGAAWRQQKKEGTASGDPRAGTQGVNHNYVEQPYGLSIRKEKKDEVWYETLANFTARIEAEITEEDGADRLRHYEITLDRDGKTYPCRVPVDEFESMRWVHQQASAKAVILPPRSNKDEVVAAIRLLSDPTERIVYTHTGWVKSGGDWFYLHGDGAVGGAAVENPGIEVRLMDALAPYKLPPPPQGADLTAGIRSVLELFRLGKPSVMFPIVAATFRAPLGPSDFTMFLVGESGAFKSEVAGLAQRFYGSTMNGRRLPGSWTSTENALESTAHGLKDALYVIDDFAPTGSPIEVNRLHAKAERIIRAQGNNSGRQRASRDGTAQRARPPRGLILSTGEDTPRGHSLRGRTYIIEVWKGDIDKERLTRCQADAAAGVYAQVMAGFLASLAPRYGEVLNGLPEQVETLRGQLGEGMAHNRTPEIVANLLVGLWHFLEFACESGAISDKEKDTLYKRGHKAILSVAQEQSAHQQESEPVERFLGLVSAAVAGGKAHLANRYGDAPDNAVAHGWRIIKPESDDYDALWGPQGDLIGWVDGDALYLNMDAAYKAAQQMGRESNDTLATSTSQLAKRLVEKGMVQSSEGSRKTPYVRKTLSGSSKKVLHLDKSMVIQEGNED